MLICGRVHWTPTLTSSYSKTFVFDRPHEYDNSPFLKIWRAFQKPPYLWPKTPFTCGREKKISVFEYIRIRVDGALTALQVENAYFCSSLSRLITQLQLVVAKDVDHYKHSTFYTYDNLRPRPHCTEEI